MSGSSVAFPILSSRQQCWYTYVNSLLCDSSCKVYNFALLLGLQPFIGWARLNWIYKTPNNICNSVCHPANYKSWRENAIPSPFYLFGDRFCAPPQPWHQLPCLVGNSAHQPTNYPLINSWYRDLGLVGYFICLPVSSNSLHLLFSEIDGTCHEQV